MPFDFRAGPVRRRVWSAGRLFILTAGLVVTYGVFFLASMRVATRAREVTVPDVRGRPLSEAQAALEDIGLAVRIDSLRRADPKVPADHVLSQDPDPGTVLRRPRAVKLRVSEGQRDPSIPAVVGMPERTAELTLAADKVAITARAEIRSTEYKPGAVVSQDPPAKHRGTAVTLLINRGASSASYVMPDLIGTLAIRAAAVLRAQGFRVSEAGEVFYPGIPSGIIVRQSPQAGYQITFGETITFEVSR